MCVCMCVCIEAGFIDAQCNVGLWRECVRVCLRVSLGHQWMIEFFDASCVPLQDAHVCTYAYIHAFIQKRSDCQPD